MLRSSFPEGFWSTGLRPPRQRRSVMTKEMQDVKAAIAAQRIALDGMEAEIAAGFTALRAVLDAASAKLAVEEPPAPTPA